MFVLVSQLMSRAPPPPPTGSPRVSRHAALDRVCAPAKHADHGLTIVCSSRVIAGGYDDDAYAPCSFRATEVERPQWILTDAETTPPATKSRKSKSVEIVVD